MPRREYYQAHKERLREYSRENSATWRLNNLEKNRKYQRAYQAGYVKNPDIRIKHNARQKVYRAVLSGKIKKGGCEVFGCRSPTEAHHDDYDKPLRVRWLCRQHHKQYHHSLDNFNKEKS